MAKRVSFVSSSIGSSSPQPRKRARLNHTAGPSTADGDDDEEMEYADSNGADEDLSDLEEGESSGNDTPTEQQRTRAQRLVDLARRYGPLTEAVLTELVRQTLISQQERLDLKDAIERGLLPDYSDQRTSVTYQPLDRMSRLRPATRAAA